MKTIRITVEKEGAQAVCTNRYQWDSSPETSDWSGNRNAFMLECAASRTRNPRPSATS